jgi:hypothetical protein
MTSLGEIAFIRDNIKNAPVKSIKALHMFIFESEGDRKNRSRLRAFKGFDFDENSKEFETKLPGDQEGLFKLAVQLRNFLNSVIDNTATGYGLLVYLRNI